MTPFSPVRLAALAALTLAACSKPSPARENEKAGTTPALPIAPAPTAAPAPAATPERAATNEHLEPPRCFSVNKPSLPKDLALEWTTKGEVSVVNVGADDWLNVRSQASPTAPLVATLAFDAHGIHATGQVCDLGEVYWYEVQTGAQRGWVSGKFLAPTTRPVDVTREWAARIASGSFGVSSSLVEALRARLSSSAEEGEVKFETVLLGLAFNGSDAVAEVRSCCLADDSVAGDQTTLRLRQEKEAWKLVRATKRTLCYRGVNTAGDLCS